MRSLELPQILEILSELIRIPSINPHLCQNKEQNEMRIAVFIRDWLLKNGIKASLEEVQPGRPNIYAEIGEMSGHAWGETNRRLKEKRSKCSLDFSLGLFSQALAQCRQNKEIYIIARMSRSIDLRRVNICSILTRSKAIEIGIRSIIEISLF